MEEFTAPRYLAYTLSRCRLGYCTMSHRRPGYCIMNCCRPGCYRPNYCRLGCCRPNRCRPLVDLNLEVVRLGTWEALKLHLERTHRLHGRGYFHIIHFDVHGKVKLIGEKNVGCLYFSDPKHGETAKEPISASIVAREVGKYSTPIAILNACESARANAGEDANIPNNFALAGVNNVLAMSYKASESAMEIFLDNLYIEFLVAGKSFTDSAMLARQMLRLQPTRQG